MAYTTIDDPSAYFQTAVWTGDGSSPRTITNDGNSDLQPDWVWHKNRSDSGRSHYIHDSTRGFGAHKELVPNSTTNENSDNHLTENHGYIASASTDSFVLGAGATNDNYTNKSSSTYVAWQWKANGGSRTTFSASGSQIAGGYQANTTAGFSIVDYTGNATNGATFPHGLGATPVIAIIKDRTNAGDGDGTNWIVVSTAQDGTSDRLYLNDTNTKYDLSGTEFRADFDSNNITLGTWNNVNASGTHIAYVFTPIQGYSKFGSYTGNGDATNGPFVYTGFRPAWIMQKRTDSADSWYMWDVKRALDSQGYFNRNDKYLQANSNGVQSTGAGFDFLSNGFRPVSTNAGYINASGGTYIYMAFAEHPFVSSEGVPATAR